MKYNKRTLDRKIKKIQDIMSTVFDSASSVVTIRELLKEQAYSIIEVA